MGNQTDSEDEFWKEFCGRNNINPEYFNKLLTSLKELLKVYVLIYEPVEEINDLVICYMK